MPDSTPLILAVGGVVLLTLYGIRQSREERMRRLSLPRPGSPEFQCVADLAFAAEFHAPNAETYPGGMVMCPCCGIEYPAGVAYCDCGNETIEADEGEDLEFIPPASPAEEQAEESLVCVHVAGSHWKASLVKSYLECHGITCFARGSLAGAFSHLHLPGEGEVRLLVQSHEASRAKALLQKCG